MSRVSGPQVISRDREDADPANAARHAPAFPQRCYIPTMTKRWAALLLAALLCATAPACSKREAGTTTPEPDTCAQFPQLCQGQAGDYLFQVGRAIGGAGSYRLSVTQTNYVLPRWGGSDGGTVRVDVKAGAAVAQLQRTGDGPYAVVLRNGETYFKRETCSTWAKIQDGSGVLAAFILTPGELQASTLVSVEPSDTGSKTQVVQADLAGIGLVTLEVDKATSLPLRITSSTLTNNGKRLEWSFSDWGAGVDIPNVSSDRLSGPGGNPC